MDLVRYAVKVKMTVDVKPIYGFSPTYKLVLTMAWSADDRLGIQKIHHPKILFCN